MRPLKYVPRTVWIKTLGASHCLMSRELDEDVKYSDRASEQLEGYVAGVQPWHFFTQPK
jgi:hypothetical protein